MVEVVAKKITGIAEAHWAIDATMPDGFAAKATLRDIYSWEHSITRTQEFLVTITGAPYFVQGHLTRHKIGVEWFCQSRRDDRGGEGNDEITRNTPVNFSCKINAEALLIMARRRLCFKASSETREVMLAMKEAVRRVDPDLAFFMVPMCMYRGGICAEPKPCGKYRVRRFTGDATNG